MGGAQELGNYPDMVFKAGDANAFHTKIEELLNEIRRRSAEQERPEVERDYLRRLLDQF